MVNSLQAVSKTNRWISNFIVGLNICPFASTPLVQNTIALRVYEGTELDIALQKIFLLIQELFKLPSSKMETAFLIMPNLELSFEEFLGFKELADDLLVTQNMEGVFQLVVFHPDFRYAESHADDLANFTNRSPYPMLHILREKSVTDAQQSFGDTESISQRNILLLRQMKNDDLKKYSE